jgi:hypothetical protein
MFIHSQQILATFSFKDHALHVRGDGTVRMQRVRSPAPGEGRQIQTGEGREEKGFI